MIEPVKEIMKEIVGMVKKARGKAIQDVDLRETQEVIDITPEELTKDDLMKMSASKPVPDDEEQDRGEVPENKLTLNNLAGRFWLFKITFESNKDMDLHISTETKANVEERSEGSVLYSNIFGAVKAKKTEIIMSELY